jgi:type IV pilus assembly protein PilN
MIQINLLPWREEAKKAKQIRFIVFFVISIIVTLFIVFVMHIYFNHLVNNEQNSIVFLQTEIIKQQSLTTTLQDEKTQQEKLRSQLEFLVNLRMQSFRAVRLLSQLVELVPSSIVLESIDRQQDVVTITGSVDSDLQLTLFIKTLSQTPGLSQVTLNAMAAQKSVSGALPEQRFQLKIKQQG